MRVGPSSSSALQGSEAGGEPSFVHDNLDGAPAPDERRVVGGLAGRVAVSDDRAGNLAVLDGRDICRDDDRPSNEPPIALRVAGGSGNMIVGNMLVGETEIAAGSGLVEGNYGGVARTR